MKTSLMKSTLIGFLVISFLALPVMALGVSPTPPEELPAPPEEAAEELHLKQLIERIGAWLFWIILALAVIFILLAAFTFLTSGGDPEKVNKAKGQLIYALVAVVVAVLAWGLVALVRAIVEGGAMPVGAPSPDPTPTPPLDDPLGV